ncbi:MAG: HAD-IC family P-type ATPase, partial [Oscillospiraceae bacterium]
DAIAKDIAQKAGLDGYQAGLLPQDKITAFEKIAKETNGICMFAGDGINDAPLLARADVGIAMGGVGSDAAIEAADAVLMTDDISRIASAIRIARGTRKIIVQNITLALGVKLIVLAVAAFGAVPMWLAIFADVGVALLAVANAARAVMIKA